MQQLNFLDPACFAELALQRHNQDAEPRQVLKSAPVQVKTSLTPEEIKAQLSEKREHLESLNEMIAEINHYLYHAPILDGLEKEARALESEHKEMLSEMYRLEQMTGGELTKSFYAKLEGLRTKKGEALQAVCKYKNDNRLRIKPALGRLESLTDQANQIKAQILELEAATPTPPQSAPNLSELGQPITRPLGGVIAPGVDVNAWRQWSGHKLQCPACPGELCPTSANTWQCNKTPLHQAHDHINLIGCRVQGGTRYFIPEVIPNDEKHLLGPACPFCPGQMQQTAPRGWECSANSMHVFWVHHGCGVWSEGSARTILKKAPAWALEAHHD